MPKSLRRSKKCALKREADLKTDAEVGARISGKKPIVLVGFAGKQTVLAKDFTRNSPLFLGNLPRLPIAFQRKRHFLVRFAS